MASMTECVTLTNSSCTLPESPIDIVSPAAIATSSFCTSNLPSSWTASLTSSSVNGVATIGASYRCASLEMAPMWSADSCDFDFHCRGPLGAIPELVKARLVEESRREPGSDRRRTAAGLRVARPSRG